MRDIGAYHVKSAFPQLRDVVLKHVDPEALRRKTLQIAVKPHRTLRRTDRVFDYSDIEHRLSSCNSAQVVNVVGD